MRSRIVVVAAAAVVAPTIGCTVDTPQPQARTSRPSVDRVWVSVDRTGCTDCSILVDPSHPRALEAEAEAQAAEAERRAEVERERLVAVARAEQQQLENRLRAEDASTVTAAEYMAIQTGMSYREVIGIIGFPGEEISRADIAGYTTVMYQWTNRNGSNMNAMFQNGALVTKAQFGL